MNKDNPCHGCTAETGRTPTCKFDGTCDLYREWSAEHNRQKEAYRAFIQSDMAATSYANQTHARLKKARKSRND